MPGHFLTEIMDDFVKMLVFDALIGNNDRHLYNWGLLAHSVKKGIVGFSPVYDTARGLFWNITDKDLQTYISYPTKIDKYIANSRPKIGWEGEIRLNHFQFIEGIIAKYPEYCQGAVALISTDLTLVLSSVLQDECKNFFSHNRKLCMYLCISKRQQQLHHLFQKNNLL
jgi:HipA-like C-terminal domain